MSAPQVVQELKRDALGRVELVEGPEGRAVRRLALGGRLPFSGMVARALLRRERRALARLAGLKGVPQPVENEAWARLPTDVGLVPRASEVLLRSWLAGEPLWAATELPRDFFERLEDLVGALHARGVCHNDLHKEANVLVGEDGRPCVIDFQLASVHQARGRTFRVRAAEDLRHVRKHRRHYELALGATSVTQLEKRRASVLAAAWMRLGKPVYNLLFRRVLRWRDDEGRRGEDGPWPVWVEAVGPEEQGRG